jgi:hypothetical protein
MPWIVKLLFEHVGDAVSTTCAFAPAAPSLPDDRRMMWKLTHRSACRR